MVNLVSTDVNSCWSLVKGTGLKGCIKIVPAELVRKLGRSVSPDDCKQSSEYVFEVFVDGERKIFTLYDMNATSLRYKDLPDPDKFWASEKLYKFHIGGRSHVGFDQFVNFLQSEVGAIDAEAYRRE